MKSLFNPRHTRCTAIVMLFVWLMTLGIGVANACLVRGAQDHNESIVHIQADQHDDTDKQSQPTDKAVCLSFCAAEQTAFVKIKQLDAQSDVQAIPALGMSGLTVVFIDLNDRPAPVAAPTRYALPVSIRFSRLTI